MIKKVTYISNEMQLKIFLTFFHKNKSLLLATSILSRSPMAYNTTAFLDKLTCADYVDFGKCQDRFGHFSWSKNDPNYLDEKLKVFRKDDKKEFRLVQNLTMGEAHFNQFMRLRNQLVNAAEKFATEENLTAVLIPTKSKVMDEQLKLAHKVVDLVDRTNRKICVILLRYNVDKPEGSYLSRKNVLFLMSIFRLYPGLKLSFEHDSVRKNLFLSAYFCWDSRISLREMDQKFNFDGNICYGNSYLEL